MLFSDIDLELSSILLYSIKGLQYAREYGNWHQIVRVGHRIVGKE